MSFIAVSPSRWTSFIPSSTTSSATRVSQPKARSGGLAVVEIHSWSWFVGIIGNGEVNSDLEASNLCAIESVPCLLCILNPANIYSFSDELYIHF